MMTFLVLRVEWPWEWNREEIRMIDAMVWVWVLVLMSWSRTRWAGIGMGILFRVSCLSTSPLFLFHHPSSFSIIIFRVCLSVLNVNRNGNGNQGEQHALGEQRSLSIRFIPCVYSTYLLHQYRLS